MSCHSSEDGWWLDEMVLRWLDKASHTIKINKRSAMNDNIDPIEEITFHFIIASG